QTGTSAKGDWKKQEIILETEEQYPRKICIVLWGDRIADIAGVQLNKEIITVSVTVESREFNGRWYTDVRGWRIQRGQVVPANVGESAQAPTPATGQPVGDDFATAGENSFDDLPF
ncbi:MAG: DUF3127 domain-containing protein, partial [Dysgonamonadaceae bacterium]|nr:DUF3127 domain-containing protein [Dysgonamonadaceae bacterium]